MSEWHAYQEYMHYKQLRRNREQGGIDWSLWRGWFFIAALMASAWAYAKYHG